MYKVLVHKGDYITYRLSDRIITDRVDVLYKRHSKLNVDDTNVKSIKKTVGNVEGNPLNRIDELTHLYAVEIYDEKFNLLNSDTSKFVKCNISNSDDIIWGKMDTEDEEDRLIAYLFGFIYRSLDTIGYGENGNLILRFPVKDVEISSVCGLFTDALSSYNKLNQCKDMIKFKEKHSGLHHENVSLSVTSKSFIDKFRYTMMAWFSTKKDHLFKHHKCIPFGLLNAKTHVKRAFIDGLADFIDYHYGDEDKRNEMILDLLLEGYGKDFVLSYRLLLETMNISYYSFTEPDIRGDKKSTVMASRTFVDIFKDVALSDTQIVNLNRGETLTQRCYLLEVDEMIGVNGYKYMHK
jgi:hypothetical protein